MLDDSIDVPDGWERVTPEGTEICRWKYVTREGDAIEVQLVENPFPGDPEYSVKILVTERTDTLHEHDFRSGTFDDPDRARRHLERRLHRLTDRLDGDGDDDRLYLAVQDVVADPGRRGISTLGRRLLRYVRNL